MYGIRNTSGLRRTWCRCGALEDSGLGTAKVSKMYPPLVKKQPLQSLIKGRFKRQKKPGAKLNLLGVEPRIS